MTQLTKFSIGDCNVFKTEDNKDVKGTIKFIGDIKIESSGSWIGIEFDEPIGDCNGSFKSKQLFECK